MDKSISCLDIHIH